MKMLFREDDLVLSCMKRVFQSISGKRITFTGHCQAIFMGTLQSPGDSPNRQTPSP